jgi:putative molybdopterin biosynthesis protein
LKYQEYIRSRLGYIGGQAVAIPMDRGAGIVTGFAKASALLIVAQDSEGLQAGEHVPVRLLRPLEEIKNSVSVIGSHDPLIDEIADLMKRLDIHSQVASGHVGSMAGIMTLKRNETHICGIHLLDAASGAYNTSFVKKYFPAGQVTLIRGVGRLQGLMVKKGNPHGVSRLQDIAEQKLSYVNRQKGSGTRILLDYLLAKDQIAPEALYGYAREEYTHTAVAAIIAQESADAGLGIFSAAKIYDLDFIPLWNEEYDFLVSNEALKLETVKRFFEILQCEELKKRLMHMGGYTFNNIGEPIAVAGEPASCAHISIDT